MKQPVDFIIIGSGIPNQTHLTPKHNHPTIHFMVRTSSSALALDVKTRTTHVPYSLDRDLNSAYLTFTYGGSSLPTEDPDPDPLLVGDRLLLSRVAL